MNRHRFLIALVLTLIAGLSALILQISPAVIAEQNGEIITKQKTISRHFNEENPGGKIDLKQIVEEELQQPADCNENLVSCIIQEVSFDITIKKKWLKLNVADMSDFEFANTVPRLKNDIDELSNSETVVMQETLARRGLLQHLNGSIVKQRGFFGPLTWLGLLRLGNIKGLDDGQQNFHSLLSDHVNNLLDKMSKDDSYIADHPLPKRTDTEPQDRQTLKPLWDKYYYLAQLAKGARPGVRGQTSIGSGVDVDIDGFVDVHRTSQ